MTALIQLLQEKGFSVAPDFSGVFIRFDHNGGTENGWFIGYAYEARGQIIYHARFGDWRQKDLQGNRIVYEWSSLEGADLPPDELEKINASIEEQRRLAEEAKRIRQEEVAKECEAVWSDAIDRGSSPYLEKKGLRGLYGAKLDPEYTDILLIPLRDVGGKLWGLQRIFPDGMKRFTRGARKKACFHLLGEIHPEGEVYVCEGFATAASVYEALRRERAVIAALDVGNLQATGEHLRRRYPSLRIIFCADNDASHGRSNPGVTGARSAAQRVGGEVRIPHARISDASGHSGSESLDFDDLRQLEGIDIVREQLEAAPEESSPELTRTPDPGLRLIRTENPESGAGDPAHKEKKPKRPSEKQIADRLLDHYGENIIRQHKSLFVYDGKRWRELDLAGLDRLKNQINAICGDTLEHRHVTSTFNTFFRYVRPVPEDVNLFNANPTAANFMNGTLHIRQSRDHHYNLEFLPHRKEDYLINVLPYDYDTTRQTKNPHFTEMLERVFEGDADKLEKIRAVKQMFGACLVPFRPHLFMLHGKPKTGKSTVIQIAEKMVSQENLCSVEPHQFNGFNMESMVGKLVNADTDITTDQPISEANVKKIIDRRMFRIRRKGIADAYGYLPGIHIFGGNGIPPTLEGAQRAHDRRWTFIDFNNPQGVGKYDIEYWLWVWEQSPQGILNFAVEGLEDLLQERGHYLNPESGKAKMDQWQTQTDIVELFVREARAGVLTVDNNSKVNEGPTYRIRMKDLWACFVTWHLDTFRKQPVITKYTFYNALRDKGYRTIPIDGYDHFAGIGVFEVPNSAF